MPKLKQRSDGGYYTRDFVFGVGPRTWQINEEGVKLLARYGIKKDAEFSKSILTELIRRDLVHTGRSGIQVAGLIASEEQISPARSSSANEVMKLAFRSEGPVWTLSIFIPDLPANWVKKIPSINTFLTACLLRVDESLNVQPTQIWPGKGGFYLPVRIHEEPYTIGLLGPWPEVAELSDWLLHVPGARSSGMLFEGKEAGGILLNAGEAVIPGGSYVLLARADAHSILRMPRGVSHHSLGRQDEWEARELHLPPVIDGEMSRWFALLGHPVERPLWHMTLVSPTPQDYTAERTPVLETGQEIIIALQPPTESSEEDERMELSFRCNEIIFAKLPINATCSTAGDDNRSQIGEIKTGKITTPIYVALPINSVGTYEILSKSGLVKPLKFNATERSPVHPDSFPQIAPLEVLVLTGSRERYFKAFAGDSKPYEVNTIADAQNRSIEVEVHCLSPVDLEWSYSEFRRRRRGVSASDVMEHLQADLNESLLAKHLFMLHVDAGAFGDLRIHILPETDVQLNAGAYSHQIEALSANTFQRARWLAHTLCALASGRDDLYVPLTRRVQTALGKFDSVPECASLARLKRAPQSLISHVISLARAVDLAAPYIPSGNRKGPHD